MEETKGASKSELSARFRIFAMILISSLDERLFAAARTDNEELLLDIFNSKDENSKDKFDINCQDG